MLQEITKREKNHQVLMYRFIRAMKEAKLGILQAVVDLVITKLAQTGKEYEACSLHLFLLMQKKRPNDSTHEKDLSSSIVREYTELCEVSKSGVC